MDFEDIFILILAISFLAVFSYLFPLLLVRKKKVKVRLDEEKANARYVARIIVEEYEALTFDDEIHNFISEVITYETIPDVFKEIVKLLKGNLLKEIKPLKKKNEEVAVILLQYNFLERLDLLEAISESLDDVSKNIAYGLLYEMKKIV